MSLCSAFHNHTGYDVYTCNGCRTNGRTPDNTGLPDGWTEGFLSNTHYCPRCTAKREAKEAAKKAKRQAAEETQAAYDATPEGKKKRNIAALSALAAVLLGLLFGYVFHLPFVALIICFIAGAPFYWLTRKARIFGVIHLLLVIVFTYLKINA